MRSLRILRELLPKRRQKPGACRITVALSCNESWCAIIWEAKYENQLRMYNHLP